MTLSQWAILGLRVINSERKAEEKQRRAPRSSWVFATCETGRQAHPIDRRVVTDQVRTCCFCRCCDSSGGQERPIGTCSRSTSGPGPGPWAEIRAMVPGGGMERGNNGSFVEGIMKMRNEDLLTYSLPADSRDGTGLNHRFRTPCLASVLTQCHIGSGVSLP
jgi:hypothetical protein